MSNVTQVQPEIAIQTVNSELVRSAKELSTRFHVGALEPANYRSEWMGSVVLRRRYKTVEVFHDADLALIDPTKVLGGQAELDAARATVKRVLTSMALKEQIVATLSSGGIVKHILPASTSFRNARKPLSEAHHRLQSAVYFAALLLGSHKNALGADILEIERAEMTRLLISAGFDESSIKKAVPLSSEDLATLRGYAGDLIRALAESTVYVANAGESYSKAIKEAIEGLYGTLKRLATLAGFIYVDPKTPADVIALQSITTPQDIVYDSTSGKAVKVKVAVNMGALTRALLEFARAVAHPVMSPFVTMARPITLTEMEFRAVNFKERYLDPGTVIGTFTEIVTARKAEGVFRAAASSAVSSGDLLEQNPSVFSVSKDVKTDAYTQLFDAGTNPALAAAWTELFACGNRWAKYAGKLWHYALRLVRYASAPTKENGGYSLPDHWNRIFRVLCGRECNVVTRELITLDDCRNILNGDAFSDIDLVAREFDAMLNEFYYPQSLSADSNLFAGHTLYRTTLESKQFIFAMERFEAALPQQWVSTRKTVKQALPAFRETGKDKANARADWTQAKPGFRQQLAAGTIEPTNDKIDVEVLIDSDLIDVSTDLGAFVGGGTIIDVESYRVPLYTGGSAGDGAFRYVSDDSWLRDYFKAHRTIHYVLRGDEVRVSLSRQFYYLTLGTNVPGRTSFASRPGVLSSVDRTGSLNRIESEEYSPDGVKTDILKLLFAVDRTAFVNSVPDAAQSAEVAQLFETRLKALQAPAYDDAPRNGAEALSVKRDINDLVFAGAFGSMGAFKEYEAKTLETRLVPAGYGKRSQLPFGRARALGSRFGFTIDKFPVQTLNAASKRQLDEEKVIVRHTPDGKDVTAAIFDNEQLGLDVDKHGHYTYIGVAQFDSSGAKSNCSLRVSRLEHSKSQNNTIAATLSSGLGSVDGNHWTEVSLFGDGVTKAIHDICVASPHLLEFYTAPRTTDTGVAKASDPRLTELSRLAVEYVVGLAAGPLCDDSSVFKSNSGASLLATHCNYFHPFAAFLRLYLYAAHRCRVLQGIDLIKDTSGLKKLIAAENGALLMTDFFATAEPVSSEPLFVLLDVLVNGIQKFYDGNHKKIEEFYAPDPIEPILRLHGFNDDFDTWPAHMRALVWATTLDSGAVGKALEAVRAGAAKKAEKKEKDAGSPFCAGKFLQLGELSDVLVKAVCPVAANMLFDSAQFFCPVQCSDLGANAYYGIYSGIRPSLRVDHPYAGLSGDCFGLSWLTPAASGRFETVLNRAIAGMTTNWFRDDTIAAQSAVDRIVGYLADVDSAKRLDKDENNELRKHIVQLRKNPAVAKAEEASRAKKSSSATVASDVADNTTTHQ